MKTAISIPDPVYKTAEQLASRLGKSRSQLYAQALSSYIAKHQRDKITEQLDEVYADNTAQLDEALLSLQLHSLPKEEW